MPNSKSIIAEGNTTNEAIENGLKELGVSKNQVKIKVLESEDKRSFFSILTPRVVKVELTVNDNLSNKEENLEKEFNNKEKHKKEIREYTKTEIETATGNLEKILDKLSKQIGEDVQYEITSNSNGLNVIINGESAGFLIGYRGETLYALQNILVAIASKGLESRVRVILDICGYKAKREKTLQELAERIARKVVKTQKPVTLEPMKPYERKIVHTTLQNSDKVETVSVGEEPRRRVVIKLK